MQSDTKCSSCRQSQMMVRSRSSRRTDPIQRLAKAFVTDARTGVVGILKPSVR